MSDRTNAPGPDLRMPALGAIAWAAAVLTLLETRLGAVVVALAAASLALRRLAGAVVRPGLIAAWLVLAASTLVTGIHLASARASPVPAIAREGAEASAAVIVRSDPVLTTGRYGAQLRFDATLVDVRARGRRYLLRDPVAVILDGSPPAPAVGSRVLIEGRLTPSHDARSTALLIGRGPPALLARPGPVTRGVDRVRSAIRAATAHLPGGAAALVPALVDGDAGAGGGTARFAAAFRTAGMTHLLAVSGTNLTIILGGLLALSRWCGVRARGIYVVSIAGVAGFVLLAGPQPSVLRAAAMGVVGVIGLGGAGPGSGLRALGTAVLVLVLLDPMLALSIGFILSVVATGGILFLAPGMRTALMSWLPRPVAEGLAVPVAAQLACTPVIAAFSGQVSLIAVGANVVVAPLVAPTTVAGLAAGLVALLRPAAGRIVAMPAGWCGQAMIEVANRASALPVPTLTWGTSVIAIAVLGLLCVAVAVLLPHLLRRRGPCILAVLLLALVVLVPLPTPGWPPHGWVMVACDIGQGDALALHAGPHRAVVVDAGPDPALVARCLRGLGVRQVPVLMLTHFHADHVDGIAGVIGGRRIGRIDISPLSEPAIGYRLVRAAAARASIPVRVVAVGEQTTIGPLHWQVLGPVRLHPESDSPPNDGSIAMLVETRGIRILMMGDEENASQADLHRRWPGLHADVLKVAHHGSARQDHELVTSIGARLAVISVGLNNDYGHPAPSTLDLLTSAGMRVLRTDTDGEVAVVVQDDGTLASVTRR